ncbi:MAG: beta-ketoacyl-[acyl-carrier-protein] synthase family protein [Myxococcales bacterium]|nr:beta-ketoacyl-[acyl-carrier-protein] synthase family protein [Myxococcales bacterium]
MSTNRRVVITGMSINTPLGDTLDGFYQGLLAGRSALSNWKKLDTSRIYSKVGADLSDYDIAAKVKSFEGRVDADVHKRLRKLLKTAPWSTQLTMLMSIDGWLDAGLDKATASGILDGTRIASIIAGHNINFNYQYEGRLQFQEEPDYMDSLLALTGLDTDHAGSVSEVLQIRGPIYTIGSACASANHALRCAVDEIRYHDVDCAVVTGAVLDFSPVELHAMALMGAITYRSFNEDPQRASRPYDTRREGFVPAHGGGTMVIEPLDLALKRGAKIYAEIVGIEANSDGNHLPQPSEEGQSRLMSKLLKMTGVAPEEIDYINAHATSTPLGDITELRSIKRVFGAHAYKLKVNATKSMLGHTCWSAPVVESIAAILQMNGGKLHPSINIQDLDPEVDIDVCRDRIVEHPVRYIMKNSFGFGGINCVAIFKRWEGK